MNFFFSLTRLILFNILIFFLCVFLIEIIFGSWFKNNFNLRLSSERNIDRVYNFDFKNHKGYSHYKRDDNGFRVKQNNINPSEVDIIFAGGSTTNQKFLNYDESIVGILDNKVKNYKIVNSGVDGMSIIGHINSFDLWFNKIKTLKPSYYIFYIGINDQFIFDSNKIKAIDELKESNFKNQIKEYFESNSFFYKQFRILKSTLFLKYNFEKGANFVNKKTVVYHERSHNKFNSYQQFTNVEIDKEKYIFYSSFLKELTNKVINNDSKIIYITQTSGHGINQNLYLISHTIMDHCKNFNLTCLNLAQESGLEYNDFYDHMHLNRAGSLKVSNYIYENLFKNNNLN